MIFYVSMPFSHIIPPSPSPTESKRLFYTSVSLLLSRIQGYHYHRSKFHIYALVYCIGVFLSGLLHSVYFILWFNSTIRASQVALVVKNTPVYEGDLRDVGSVPGWEDVLQESMAIHSSILVWRIPWTEEPGRL